MKEEIKTNVQSEADDSSQVEPSAVAQRHFEPLTIRKQGTGGGRVSATFPQG